MVMKAHRLRKGNKIPEGTADAQDGPGRSISQVGYVDNGGSDKDKEENTRLDGDGVKKDNIKALSSLDSNKVLKRSSTPTKHSSLKVVLDLTAPQKGNVSSVKENKENIENEWSNHSLAHKENKQSYSNLDEDSGSNNDCSMVSKKRKKTMHYSPSQNAEATIYREEGELPLSSESLDHNDNVSNTLDMFDTVKPCPPSSWSKSVQDYSCTTDTRSTSPSLPREQATSNIVLREVNALPLFVHSDSLKPMGEEIAEHDKDGLSILGAAAFLSLGLDETSRESVKESNCPYGQKNCSKDDIKEQAKGIAINTSCSVTNNATTNKNVQQSSPDLGADLTLAPPMDIGEETDEDENNTKVSDKDTFPLDGFSVSEKILLQEEIDIQHSAIETGPSTVQMPSMEIYLVKQDETGNTVVEPDNIVTHLKKIDKVGKHSTTKPQLGSEVPICSLNTDSQIIDDCLSHKDTGDEELVGRTGRRKEYMNFSDLPIPLRGTLLLPRGQKRARRFPIQFKRSKNEVLLHKKEVGKKEPVSKFSRVTAPSGLLADLNPGIISRVRNSKQVHAIIEAVVGPDVLTTYQDDKQSFQQKPKMNPTQKAFGMSHTTSTVDNDDSEVVDINQRGNYALDKHGQYISNQGLKWKLEERITTAVDACVSAQLDGEEKATDANPLEEAFECLNAKADFIPPVECSGDQFDLKQVVGEHCHIKATFNCHCHYCRPGEMAGMDSTCSTSLTFKAARVASHWLELYYQDIKGRIAALKRSRKRVRTVVKEVFGYTSLEHTSASHENDKLFVEVPHNKQHAKMLANAEGDHMEKWRSLFIHMDKRLNAEDAQLEISLEQIKQMQAHCKWGLEVTRPDIQQVQKSEPLEDQFRSKLASGKTVERQYALGAAAASIYSTANFVSTSEDVPCF